MKKLFLTLVLFVCTYMLSAAEYQYMIFVTNNQQFTFPLTSISMTFDSKYSQLNVSAETDNEVVKHTFDLADIQKMYFSQDANEATNLQQTAFMQDEPVSVILPNGVEYGRFMSVKDAVLVLPAGTYIIKQGSNTQKILVK